MGLKSASLHSKCVSKVMCVKGQNYTQWTLTLLRLQKHQCIFLTPLNSTKHGNVLLMLFPTPSNVIHPWYSNVLSLNWMYSRHFRSHFDICLNYVCPLIRVLTKPQVHCFRHTLQKSGSRRWRFFQLLSGILCSNFFTRFLFPHQWKSVRPCYNL